MKKLLPVIILSILFSTCELFETTVTKTIKYEVIGTAEFVNITINNSGGNTEQFSNVPIPWNISFDVVLDKNGYDYFFIYVSAQNMGSTGSVTSNIYVDGKVAQTATSSGAYVIATASGSVKP